jgi:hypothetical protein
MTKGPAPAQDGQTERDQRELGDPPPQGGRGGGSPRPTTYLALVERDEVPFDLAHVDLAGTADL